MPTNCVLQIPRSDSDRDVVLVNVVSNGPAVLDLKLVATEGTSPFTTTSDTPCYDLHAALLTSYCSQAKQCL